MVFVIKRLIRYDSIFNDLGNLARISRIPNHLIVTVSWQILCRRRVSLGFRRLSFDSVACQQGSLNLKIRIDEDIDAYW